MTLLYPLGLLGLIGIPVLIFIYIIKNKYTEQTIASTYLWTLSERFLKRRVPINKLVGIISLILQILAVTCISLAIAHPVITVHGAAHEYCFVLDGSGSMNAVQGGKTRFDIGKQTIQDMISKSMSGSTYTLIYAGETAETVFEDVGDKKRALDILADLEVNYTTSDVSAALEEAQEYFNGHTSSLVYFVTDASYSETANVTVVNVAEDIGNYSLSDVGYLISAGGITISGNAVSYGGDATLNIELYFDGESERTASAELSVKDGEPTPFEFTSDKTAFTSFKVVITNGDSLALDNEVTVYNVQSENMARTLLVCSEAQGDPAFFLRAAMTAAGNRQIEMMTVGQYEAAQNLSGYGLYVFCSYMPKALPTDGAVWFVNPTGSVSGTNFSVQDLVGSTDAATGTYSANFSSSTASIVRNMLSGIVDRQGFEVKRYVKLGLNGSFSTLISCEGNPLVFLGANVYGNRQVVFAFDLSDATAFTLSAGFSALVSNLTSYSFPSVIEKTDYYCGDTLGINVPASAQSIRIETPLGNEAYPDTTAAVSEYQLAEVGTYNIVLVMKDNSERVLNVFAALPDEERATPDEERSFVIQGDAGNDTLDGIFDILIILFIILAVIVVADYGVYCYEQYQLR